MGRVHLFVFAAIFVASTYATQGALFTSMCNGDVVNANVQYPTKYDVYLNGGPQNCGGAAGLTDGWYFFQITEPAGKVLLSTDSILARQVRIEGGYFVEYSNARCTTGWPASGKSPAIPAASAEQCVAHLLCSGKCPNTTTVQMMPFLDTPNPGGEYKAWIVPIEDYSGVDTNNFGFVNSPSKTDNFKILTLLQAKSPETTAPPTTQPALPPAQPPAQPPAEPPAAPPQQPPAQPPAEPPAAPDQPPAQPPVEPPALPPAAPPEQPAAEPPANPAAEPSTQTSSMNLPPPLQSTAGSPIVEVGANPNQPTSTSAGGGSLSKAAIVGIAVAGVAALVAAALLGVFLLAKANTGPGSALFGQGAHGTSHDNPIHATPYKMFDNPLSA